MKRFGRALRIMQLLGFRDSMDSNAQAVVVVKPAQVSILVVTQSWSQIEVLVAALDAPAAIARNCDLWHQCAAGWLLPLSHCLHLTYLLPPQQKALDLAAGGFRQVVHKFNFAWIRMG